MGTNKLIDMYLIYLGELGHFLDPCEFSQKGWLLGTKVVIDVNHKGRYPTRIYLETFPDESLEFFVYCDRCEAD